MLNRLKLGLVKGHVMHFMDEWQPIIFARIWFLLLMCLRQKRAFSITESVLLPKWI